MRKRFYSESMKPTESIQPKATLINQPIVEMPYSDGNRALKNKMSLDLSATRSRMMVNFNYESLGNSPSYNLVAVQSPIDRMSFAFKNQKKLNSASLEEESPLISETSNLTAFTEIVSYHFNTTSVYCTFILLLLTTTR